MEIIKHLELNNPETTTSRNLWEAANKGKIMLNTYIGESENWIATYWLKELEKVEQV